MKYVPLYLLIFCQDEAAKKREEEEEMKRLKQEMFEREMKAELEYQRTQGLR